MDKVIHFEAVPNFRDMGGYKTHNNKTVKNGLFYRSAALGKMTAADKINFAKLGIKTVLDYRDDNEAQKNPDPELPNVKNIRVPAKLNDLIEMPNAAPSNEKYAFYKQVTPQMFSELYQKMVFDNAAFKQLMAIAQQPNELGLLHHCAIGKDRTGIGGALILLALDVPRETIMADYLTTNSLLKPVIDKLEQTIRGDLSEQELQRFRQLMTADERYLNAVFDGIDTRYSSVSDFLYDQFAITKEKRRAMQSFCLI